MKGESSHHDLGLFGFWLYILSDCIIFAILFSTFAILRGNVYGGVDLKTLMNLPDILLETMLLLGSSLSYGLATLASYQIKRRQVLFYLAITLFLGLSFVGLELKEFLHLSQLGQSWETSASLSAFFTLVGTHGLHVSLGLVWMFILMIQLCFFGLTPFMQKRLLYLGLFWTFLDLVWIFVFTIVYLMGAS